MKNFFNDSEDSQEDKLTKEDKIQIIIKIVPILLIIVILLITFVVNKNKNQKPDETPQDVVSTEIIVPSSSPSAVQETEADPSPDVAASKATAFWSLRRKLPQRQRRIWKRKHWILVK